MVTKHIKHLQNNKHALIVSAIVLGLLLYAGLNVWVFSNAKKIAGSPQTMVSEIIRNVRKSVSSLFPLPSPKEGVTQVIETDKSMAPGYTQTKTSPTPIPSPPPKNGPKPYACSKEGVCNLYSDEVRKEFCSVTYADPACLNQCSDSSKRCTK